MQKHLWQSDKAIVQQPAREFARPAIDHRLPGSCYPPPDHPMLEWIEPRLTDSRRRQLREVRDAAKVQKPEAQSDPATIRQIEKQKQSDRSSRNEKEPDKGERPTRPETPFDWTVIIAALVALVLLIGGIVAGRRGGKRHV
jgi:cobaltochelatase CobN